MIAPRQNTKNALLLATALVLVLGAGIALCFANYAFVQQNPGGNDFLVYWTDARFAWKGVQPYDARVSLAAQEGIYGHPADASRGEDLSLFVYPLYSLLFFGPFGLLGFVSARAIWMTLLEVATAAFALLSAAVAGWLQDRRWKTAIWLLVSLIGYFSLRAIINGNAIVLVGLFLALSIFLLGKNKPLPAGLFLAFSTIKPQIVVFPIIWILLWCLFQKRYSFLLAFGMALLMLVAVPLLFVPDWIGLELRNILVYPGYTQPGNPASAFALWFGPPGLIAGWAVSILGSGFMIWVWLKSLRAPFPTFLLVLGITFSALPLLGIPFDPGNEYLMLLPLALGLSVWADGSRRNSIPWGLALAAIFFGLWAIFLATIRPGAGQSPILLFPLPVLLWIWLAWLNARNNRIASGSLRICGDGLRSFP